MRILSQRKQAGNRGLGWRCVRPEVWPGRRRGPTHPQLCGFGHHLYSGPSGVARATECRWPGCRRTVPVQAVAMVMLMPCMSRTENCTRPHRAVSRTYWTRTGASRTAATTPPSGCAVGQKSRLTRGNCGGCGIRTHGTPCGARRFSRPLPSTGLGQPSMCPRCQTRVAPRPRGQWVSRRPRVVAAVAALARQR